MRRSGRYGHVVTARARTFSYDVALDREWTARSTAGGTPIRNEEEWTAEHLVLAGLCRCLLKSYRYHARRAGYEPVTSAAAQGVVTRREDGRFAISAVRVGVDITLEPAPRADELRALIGKGERDCFIGASLTITPDYHWTVNGEDFS